MSQYYSLRVGYIHDEDYVGWVKLCKKLKGVGLLNDDTKVYELGWEEDEGLFYQIMCAIRDDVSGLDEHIKGLILYGVDAC